MMIAMSMVVMKMILWLVGGQEGDCAAWQNLNKISNQCLLLPGKYIDIKLLSQAETRQSKCSRKCGLWRRGYTRLCENSEISRSNGHRSNMAALEHFQRVPGI